jgi:hypothetical protein
MSWRATPRQRTVSRASWRRAILDEFAVEEVDQALARVRMKRLRTQLDNRRLGLFGWGAERPGLLR